MDLETFVNELRPLGRANPVTNFRETRDSYVSMAIVRNGDLQLDWGASYTWPTGYIKIGTSIAATGSEPISGSNIVDVLRSMSLRSQVWFFPHGTMKGSKAAATPTKESEIFGILPVALDTGVLTELVELRVKGMHLNIDFWNGIRANPTGYQVFLFLNNMVVWVKPEHTPTFHDISGLIVGGDSANSITAGNVQLSYQSVQEVAPKEGVLFRTLGKENFQFSFAVPVPTTLAVSACASGGLKLTGTALAGGSFTRPINEAAYSDCVTYSLKILSGPAMTGITVNPDTGVVTVAAAGVAGTYNIRVLAQNNSSVYGFYDAVIVLS